MIKFFRRVVLFVAIFVGVVYLGQRYFDSYLDAPLATGGDQIFVLSNGSSFSAMLDELQRRGWLTQPELLKAYARFNPQITDIKAGEYAVAAGTSLREWLAQLSMGRVLGRQLTLVEGWTLGQALSYLATVSHLTNPELVADDSIWQQLDISSPISASPEGLFFPDSYEYIRGDSSVDILRRSYQRLIDILMDEWQSKAANLPYKSPYEALIMASIVERETGAVEERTMIAGVFVRRLKMGMRLQTDPTIIYGLGARYDGNLRRSHLLDATNPYNTYKHHGLPPTPIALVGREAIHAALHPDDSKNLYFVAKGDGSHRFSATLGAHEAAVREFQINKRKRNYRSAPK